MLILSKSEIDEIRKEYCEYCGLPAPIEGYQHIHHIHHRGSGGKDIAENLMQLCPECHAKAHAGEIKLWEQIVIVANREGKTPEEICEAIDLLADKLLPQNYKLKSPGNPFGDRTLDDVLQIYFQCEEVEGNSMWAKATILAAMQDSGLKVKNISALCGCSPAAIRERIRTYRAFPDETMRAIDKSFTHHRLAAKTKKPAQWIDLVCEMDLSTRQLKEAIEAEGQGETIKKDVLLEKAERTVRMVKEVLIEQCEAAGWLQKELENILRRRDADEGTNEVLCITPDPPCNNSEVYQCSA